MPNIFLRLNTPIILLKYSFLLLSLSLVIHACYNRDANSNEDELIGNTISFMRHAVTLYNYDSSSIIPDFNSDFKIVSYSDLYCYPCWESILPWKSHLADFEKYKNVSIFFYVYALKSDFDIQNRSSELDFPIFLDTQNRFRIVNKLGNDPNRLTFLLNKNNEIILVGPPFSEKMKRKYIDIITTGSKKYNIGQ